MNKISIIGLGKLGLCLACFFASRGKSILGIDIDKRTIGSLRKGKAPFQENGLQQLIDANKNNIYFSTDYSSVISDTDITFLILPTPSDKDGSFSDKLLCGVLKRLSSQLKNTKKKYHLFVVNSTVSPGSVQNTMIPLIEKFSGRKCNEGFGVCYNPLFIALGNVISDLSDPDLVLIGESDTCAGNILQKTYRSCKITKNIKRMSIISAEIAKLSVNCYLTMKISFSNTLSNICEGISGAEVDKISMALGSDRRISPDYLKGGLSYGGPCFPRDNKAFISFCKKNSCDSTLSRATDQFNKMHLDRCVKMISELRTAGAVSILGLSYKPGTPVMDESPSIYMINKLIRKKIEVIVYDPLAINNAKTYFGDKIKYASSIKEIFRRTSTCIIATESDEFKKIDKRYIANDPTTIIDCWRILSLNDLGSKVKYFALGTNYQG